MKIARLTVLFCLSWQFAVAQPFKVVGYLPTYRFSWLNDIEFQRLTHVNIAFANPDSLGNLSCDGVNIDPAISKAQQNGCKVFISLAGGYLAPDIEANWEKFALPANRPAFIQKIRQYVQNHHLDGVDLDLEWQYVKDWYSPFVLELKAELNAYSIPLTVALPGSHRYSKITPAALAAFDWVNMMVYDLRGPWDPSNPGQHSPYDWAVQCIQYWKNQGVPGSKLTLGVPFYGYDFGVSPVASFTFRGIVNQDPANAFLDETGMKYWNGIPTIQAKTELAKAEVSGIMIWEIGQDAFGANIQYSLLRAIDEALGSSGTIAGIDSKQVLKLWPNPAREVLYLQSDRLSDAQITVNDLQGRILLSETLSSNSLNISQLQTGLYLLTLKTPESIYTGKFIKQ
jgi:GH18 family chitinase